MAHTCPDCGSLCHCGGDIDDIDMGDDTEEADACTHCDDRRDEGESPDDTEDWD